MLAKYVSYAAALSALSMVAGQSASAAVITVNSNASDAFMFNTDVGGTDSGDLHVGRVFGQARLALFAFQLPSIPGEVVTNATLSVYLNEKSGDTTLFNVDLYAVRQSSTSPDMVSTDWGWGTTAGGTSIQDNYFTSGTADGYVPTSAGGNAALLNFVNTGYTPGNYLIFRLNPDSPEYANIGDLANGTFYRTASSEWGGAGARVAQLELTTAVIPEPATVFVLAGVAGVLGLSRRRQV